LSENRRAFFVALCGIAIHVSLFFPGWLSFDSAYQLWQARHWYFNNLSPVPMTAWLAVLTRVFSTDSAAPLFIFHLMLFWFGCALLIRETLSRRTTAAIALILFGLLSPLWWTLANVWTDSAMLAGFTAGVGLTCYSRQRRSRALHMVALLPLLYGSMVRLNGLAAALPLFLLWWMSRSDEKLSITLRAVGVVAMMGIVSVGTGMWLDRTLANERVRTWPVQVLHDLAAISITSNTMYVPSFARDPALTIDTLRGAYTPYVAVPILLVSPPLRSGLTGDAYTRDECLALLKAWVGAIAAEPIAYLSHRAKMMRKLLVYPDQAHSYAMGLSSVGYKDNPYSLALTSPAAQLVASLDSTAWRFHFSLLPYMLLLVGLSVHALMRTRDLPPISRGVDATFTLLGASAVMHLLPLLLLAPASDVRYVSWPVAAILFASWIYLFENERAKTQGISRSTHRF
jgi:hypothetical protein